MINVETKVESKLLELVGQSFDEAELGKVVSEEEALYVDGFLCEEYGCFVINEVIFVPSPGGRWKLLGLEEEIERLSGILAEISFPALTLPGLIYSVNNYFLYLRKMPGEGWLLNHYLDGASPQSSTPFFVTEMIKDKVSEQLLGMDKPLPNHEVLKIIVRQSLEALTQIKYGSDQENS
jgi:hypothetical protein